MAEKSSWDQANMVWFGEIERNKTNYQRLLLLTVLPLNYFMSTIHGLSSWFSSTIIAAESTAWEGAGAAVPLPADQAGRAAVPGVAGQRAAVHQAAWGERVVTQ